MLCRGVTALDPGGCLPRMGDHTSDHLAERPCTHPGSLCRGLKLPTCSVDRSPAAQELNRIERELDANPPPGGKPVAKRGGGQAGKLSNRFLDAVLATAVLLFVVAAALVFTGRLKDNERMLLTAGSAGGAVGLLLGHGVGTEALRPRKLSSSSPRRYRSERCLPRRCRAFGHDRS